MDETMASRFPNVPALFNQITLNITGVSRVKTQEHSQTLLLSHEA
jgi:hypothetical protein